MNTESSSLSPPLLRKKFVDTEKEKTPMCFREQHVPENAVISHRICADLDKRTAIRRPGDQIRGIYFVAGGCGAFTTSHVLFIL